MSRLDTAECSSGANTALSPAIIYSSNRAGGNSAAGSQQQEMWPSSMPNSQPGSNSKLAQSGQSPKMRPTSPVSKDFRMQYPPDSPPSSSSANVMIDGSTPGSMSAAVPASIDSSSSMEHCKPPRSVIPESPQDPSSSVFSQPLYVRWMYTAVSAPLFHQSTHFSQHEGYLHHQSQAWQHEQQQSPTDKNSCVERSPPVALSDMAFSVPNSPAILPSFRSQSFSFANSRHPQQQYVQRKSIPAQLNQQNGAMQVMQTHEQQKQIQHGIPRQMAQHYHHQPQQCSPTTNPRQNHVPGSPHSRQSSHTPHISFSSPLHHPESLRSSPPQDQVLRSLNASPQSKSSSRRNTAQGSNSGIAAPRSFSCYVEGCKKSYSTGAGLRYHLKSFHDTITPRAASIKAKSRTFCCPECPLKAFSTAAGLRYHCKTVHS